MNQLARTHAPRQDSDLLDYAVHSLPGRVRLRFPSRERAGARGLVHALAAHPAVLEISWVEPINSMTVRFDRAQDLGQILSSLERRSSSRRDRSHSSTDALGLLGGHQPHQAERPIDLDWRRILLSCVLALIPLGPVGGVIVALGTSLAEQRRETRTRPPVPAACPAVACPAVACSARG